MVDSQGEAFVNAVTSVSGTVLVVRAAQCDVGKIIGKQGRTARSLRTLLSAASMKMGLAFSLDVQEEPECGLTAIAASSRFRRI